MRDTACRVWTRAAGFLTFPARSTLSALIGGEPRHGIDNPKSLAAKHLHKAVGGIAPNERNTHRGSLALEDITKLIDAGKGKDYLTHNEVNDLIPHVVHSPEELEDLLATVGTQGFEVLENRQKPSSSALKKEFGEEVEPGENIGLDLPLGALERTKDPVRIYLREMGKVPLLTREEEVNILQAHRARTAARAEGAFPLACCDPPDSGHWRRFEIWRPLNQGNCRLQ